MSVMVGALPWPHCHWLEIKRGWMEKRKLNGGQYLRAWKVRLREVVGRHGEQSVEWRDRKEGRRGESISVQVLSFSHTTLLGMNSPIMAILSAHFQMFLISPVTLWPTVFLLLPLGIKGVCFHTLSKNPLNPHYGPPQNRRARRWLDWTNSW